MFDFVQVVSKDGSYQKSLISNDMGKRVQTLILLQKVRRGELHTK